MEVAALALAVTVTVTMAPAVALAVVMAVIGRIDASLNSCGFTISLRPHPSADRKRSNMRSHAHHEHPHKDFRTYCKKQNPKHRLSYLSSHTRTNTHPHTHTQVEIESGTDHLLKATIVVVGDRT